MGESDEKGARVTHAKTNVHQRVALATTPQSSPRVFFYGAVEAALEDVLYFEASESCINLRAEVQQLALRLHTTNNHAKTCEREEGKRAQ